MPSIRPWEDDRAPPTLMGELAAQRLYEQPGSRHSSRSQDPLGDLEKNLADVGVYTSPRCLLRVVGDNETPLKALVDYLAEKIYCMEKEHHRWQDAFESRLKKVEREVFTFDQANPCLKKVEKQSLGRNPFPVDQPQPCDEAHWPGPSGPKWDARLEDVKMLADAQASFQHSASPPLSGESTKDRLYFPPLAGARATGESKCALPDPSIMYDDGRLQHDLAKKHDTPQSLQASVVDKAVESNLFHVEQLVSRALEELAASREAGALIADSTKQFECVQKELHRQRQAFESLWMSHNGGREISVFDGTWVDAETSDKVGDIRGGVMTWVESYKRDASLLTYENPEGAEVLQFEIDGVTHRGSVTFCEYSGKRRIAWDSGDTWLHMANTDDIKTRARKARSSVLRNINSKVLPFQEQLNKFESRRAHHLRGCASWSLLGFFVWYTVYCMHMITHPVDNYDLSRDLQYWSSGEESLPFIAFDIERLPTGYELEVTHVDMDDKGHDKEKRLQLENCTVHQRSRTSAALCMPTGTKILGTYGDPSYKFVKVKVLVPKTEFYKRAWNSMAVYHRFHHNQYARFIESLYLTYPNGVNKTSVNELSFEKIDCMNGTSLGLVEALGLSSMLYTERITSLKERTSRFETFEEKGDKVVAMKLYFRAALTEVFETYEPSSMINFFENAGSLFSSFGCFLALVVVIAILVPRIVGRCLYHNKPHKKNLDILRAKSQWSDYKSERQ